MSDRPLRVVIQQPSLAKYRVPVYRALSAEPGIDLTLVYGQDEGIPNVQPEGFTARFEPHRHVGLVGKSIFEWSSAQLKYADPATTDVLVMVWNSRWLSLPLALRRARRRGVRTVVWGHGYSKNEAPWRARLRRRVGEMADAVLFYSRTIADRYIADGFPAEKVFVATNAIDQVPVASARDRWLGDPGKLAAFRQSENLQPDTPVLLYVSRFDAANRVDLLLRATARLRERVPGLRVHLIGKGEPEAGRLRLLTDELQLHEQVRFLGAIYEEEALAPWFLTATVYVYPDNIGLSLLHAFGYGLPVVTADDPLTQNPEVEALHSGLNGRTYKAGSLDDLVATLEDLLMRADLATLREDALRTVAEEHSLDAMVGGFLEAVRGDACSPRASPHAARLPC